MHHVAGHEVHPQRGRLIFFQKTVHLLARGAVRGAAAATFRIVGGRRDGRKPQGPNAPRPPRASATCNPTASPSARGPGSAGRAARASGQMAMCPITTSGCATEIALPQPLRREATASGHSGDDLLPAGGAFRVVGRCRLRSGTAACPRLSLCVVPEEGILVGDGDQFS
jgi:hypothetical protein